MSKSNKKLKHRHLHRKKTKLDITNNGSAPHTIIFERALALHQEGHLEQAETLYRQILAKQPNHPRALHYLGILAHQVGQTDIAINLINKALNIIPDYVDAQINLGSMLKAQGRLDEAISILHRAITLNPQNPLAYYNMGNALSEKGRLEEAIISFRQAVTLKPDYSKAYFALGKTLHEQGKLDEAEASFRHLLKLNPGDIVAYNNLGNILTEQNKLEEAIACYKKALALRSDDAVTYFNLGNIYKEQRNYDSAIDYLQQAIKLKANFPEVYHALGVIFKELGKFDDAITNFRHALSLKHDYARSYLGLSSIVKFTEFDDTIRLMENLYNKKELSGDDRVYLGFALGKVFEDLKDYDKSFNYIFEANKLKRKTYEYSFQKDRDFFEKEKKYFSHDFFAANQDVGNPDKLPIFILGMPRSGTTLVEQILASHKLVFGAGELHLLHNLINSFCSNNDIKQFPECLLDFDRNMFARMGGEYIRQIRKLSCEAAYITDKMPHNFLYVGLIKTILPNSKVIHCIRDPMDNCFSIFKNNFEGEHKYAYDLVELGQYYNLYSDLMAHWEKVLPGFMYTLSYEKLVADQQNQIKKLIDFCGLPWSETCLAFHKTERRVSTASSAQVRQPVYRDSVKLWRRYERQLKPLKKAIDS